MMRVKSSATHSVHVRRAWFLPALGLLYLFMTGAWGRAQAGLSPERILVLYNASDMRDDDKDGTPDSLQVARYYAARRGVPAGNLLGLDCSTDFRYTKAQYTNFLNEIVRPVLARLRELGPDRIDVLLFCYRLPLGYNDGERCIDNAMLSPAMLLQGNPTNPPVVDNPYLDPAPGVRGEGRPFRHARFTCGFNEMYLVSRLDGPGGVWRAMDLVDQALYAERFLHPEEGYFHGFGYVDSRTLKGAKAYTEEAQAKDSDILEGRCDSYASADANIAYTARHIVKAGFPLRWENTSVSIGAANAVFGDGALATNAPQAMFYGGWYNLNAYRDVWEWLPGAVACDLNSDSLYDVQFRRPVRIFGANALARGVSCVAGVIAEPYVNGHPRPHILLYYILNGYTFAEAAGAAMPSINWVGISVGDPLYAPLRPGRLFCRDTTWPRFAEGFPRIVSDVVRGVECQIVVAADDEPKVVQAQVAWGASPDAMTNCLVRGQGWYRRQSLRFSELRADADYFCCVTAADPAGHAITSGVVRFHVPGRWPFGGVPRRIPGVVPMSHFDEGVEGVTYHAWGVPFASFRGEQGFELHASVHPGASPAFLDGRQPAGAWLEYTVDVATSGVYDAAIVLGGFHGRGGDVRLRQDGEDRSGLVALTTNAPAAWDCWTTSSVPMRLDAGAHVLRLELLRDYNAPLREISFMPAKK